jgi:hypothetical protein
MISDLIFHFISFAPSYISYLNLSCFSGLIDQFESTSIDAKMACEMVAEDLVKKGMFEDSVNLFELASVSIFSHFFQNLQMLYFAFSLAELRTNLTLHFNNVVPGCSSEKQAGFVERAAANQIQ